MIYAITLFVRGKPWLIVVDDYVPIVVKDYQWKPYYSEIYRSNYWVPIFEKAIAKVMGSYSHLED